MKEQKLSLRNDYFVVIKFMKSIRAGLLIFVGANLVDSWAYSYGIIAGETLEVLTSLAFGFTLFLFVSHIFFTLGGRMLCG